MKKLIPVVAFMENYDMSPFKFYGLANKGEIHVVKCGGRSYVTEEEEARFRQSLPAYRSDGQRRGQKRRSASPAA